MRVEPKPLRRSLQHAEKKRGGSRAESRIGPVASTFESHLAAVDERLATMELDELLQVVEEAGRRLLRHRGEEQLKEYKEAVKAFVSRAVERCFEVIRSERFNLRGQRVITVLVRRVDEELEALTAAIASKNSAAMRLAARLDEIRGLLLDFYR